MAIISNGLVVPSTPSVDVSSLKGKGLDSPELTELLVRLYQQIGAISIASNQKDIGLYILNQGYNGQQWFPNPAAYNTSGLRSVIRVTINFGALPDAGTKFVAHGITVTSTTTFTRIYATASDTTGETYIPIPFVSVSGTISAGNTEISVDNTNVYITTTGNGSNYNVCYVILEYIAT